MTSLKYEPEDVSFAGFDRAFVLITQVAAELVRQEGVDDPELEEFKPMGKQKVRSLRKANIDRVHRLKKAMDQLLNDRREHGQPKT